MKENYQDLQVPGPVITPLTRPFWDAVARNELLLPWCAACRQHFFYPRRHCPHCWSDQVEWRRAEGRGVIKSFSVIHRAGHFAWQPVTPYVIVLVRLTEGPTMLSQLVDPPGERVSVGAPVRLACVRIGAFSLPFFRLNDVTA